MCLVLVLIEERSNGSNDLLLPVVSQLKKQKYTLLYFSHIFKEKLEKGKEKSKELLSYK